MEVLKMYANTVKNIVNKYGGYREKNVLNNDHEIVKGETWNNNHKVLYILETTPDKDGYKNGFAVDLVTRSICG
jgi:hypothetical protein